MTKDYILRAEGIQKTYGKGSAVTNALKPTSLAIERGGLCALIGRSGSGKSTLLRLLSGLEAPDEGQIYLEGVPVHGMSEEKRAILRRRRMGFVFQENNLISEYKVEKNIYLPLLLDGRKPDKKYAKEVIGMLDITHTLHKYPEELSGGERQRAAIARALISKPAIIIADEPTGSLDTANGENVLELLQQSVRLYNQTIIMATHDLDMARQADRVIRMKDGEIIGEDSEESRY